MVPNLLPDEPKFIDPEPVGIKCLETTIEPLPFGSMLILPFVSVEVIELPSIFILSTSTEVNLPVEALLAPIVVPSIAPLSISTFVIFSLLQSIAPPN